MNATQLIQQVNECGGRIWLESDNSVKCKAPPELVPLLRQHKAEIIDLLRRKRIGKVQVWQFIVDGKNVLAIDFFRLRHDEMLADLCTKFGAERVGSLKLNRSV